MDERIFTVSEAAKYLRCHPETIRRAIRDGRLRPGKLGRGYRISIAQLDAFWKKQVEKKGYRAISLRESIYEQFEAKAKREGRNPELLIMHLLRLYLKGDLDNFLKRTPVK